jgi:putative heme-binding domain-containing protein
MRYVLILLLAASLAGQEAQLTQPKRNPRTTPEDVAAGAKTFRSHCSPCHGLRGEGGRGPNLAGGRFSHGSSDLELFTNISEGIPDTDMPGIFYSADRVWQVVAYVRSLHTIPKTVAGNTTHGMALVRSKGCLQCHRVGVEGSTLGPDLSGVGAIRSADYIRQSIIDPDAYVQPRYWLAMFKDNSGEKREGFVMSEDTYTVQILDLSDQLHSYDKSSVTEYKVEKRSAMPSYRQSLSETELNDLVVYLSALRPESSSQ